MRPLKPLLISGREVLPLVEGGKGIAISNGESSGAWAVIKYQLILNEPAQNSST